MLIETEKDVTSAVLAAMQNTPIARTKTILESLVRHIHGFIRETRWYCLAFDFTIEPGEASRPRPPITAKAAA